MNNIN